MNRSQTWVGLDLICLFQFIFEISYVGWMRGMLICIYIDFLSPPSLSPTLLLWREGIIGYKSTSRSSNANAMK
jgi:hypothetical protein